MNKTACALFVLMLFSVVAIAANQNLSIIVKLKDDKTQQCKLDSINTEKVLCFVIGPDKRPHQAEFPLKDVRWVSFESGNHTDVFSSGEEGYVLKNGKVIKGKVLGMKGPNFLIRRPNASSAEEVSGEDIAFIQYPKAGEAAPSRPELARVVVPATEQWTSTGVTVKTGDKIRTEVSANEVVACNLKNLKVNADGADPFWADPQRPLPEVKACALIGRVGGSGAPFRIGLNATPFVMKEDGMLQLGINDSDLRDNAGSFHVTVFREQ